MEPVAIQFSQEELYVLLRMMGQQALANGPLPAFEGWPDACRQLGEGTVLRSLLARQLLLTNEDGSATMDADVAKLLMLCTQPEARLVITSRLGDGAGAVREFYYRVGTITVQHLISPMAIHQLTLFQPSPDLDRILAAQVMAHTAVADVSDGAFQVEERVMGDAQLAANHEEPERAAALLSEAGMPSDAASALARAMTGPTLRLVVELTRADSDEVATLTIIGDDESCWAAWPEGSHLHIERATEQVLTARLAALTTPIEATGS